MLIVGMSAPIFECTYNCRTFVAIMQADYVVGARSAEILNESEAPDGSGTNYILRVAERSEWDTVLALRDDPDVATAGLIDQEPPAPGGPHG
jgi:hypothetical protein